MKKFLKFLTKDRVIFSKRITRVIRLFMYLFILFVGLVVFVPPHLDVDKEIKPYVDEIIKLSDGNLGKKIKRIGFIQENSKVLGRCYMTNKTISINKKYWKSLSKWSKIMLVAHELIHCECNVKHIPGLRWDDCPVSIMYPSDGGEYCNARYRSEYIREMKTIGCD